jgi:hypothetical protein
LAGIALLCPAGVFFRIQALGSAGTEFTERRGSLFRLRRASLQALGGALLGVAVVAPWVAVPWLVISARALVWGGRAHGGRGWGGGSGFALVVLAAIINLATVSVAYARGLRMPTEDFASRDFPVNDLLADVPLHDVWVVDLGVEGPTTMDQVGEAFRHSSPFQSTPAVVGLSLLRMLMGVAFGWDEPRWAQNEASFVHRLGDTHRSRSTTNPGTRRGIWTVVYVLPEEGVVETLNGTAHVAVSCTVGEEQGGTRLFLAFRVREVNWTTPYYMKLIDPFRRFWVYPPLIRQFAHTMRREGSTASPPPSGGPDDDG